MQVDRVLQMKAGTGDSSYARNSLIQKTSIAKSRPLLDECIRELCNITITKTTNSMSNKDCLVVADLGCSSGPNALLTISFINNILSSITGSGVPSEVAVFLNDLPQNDFNSIFRMLPSHGDLQRPAELKNDNCGNNDISYFISGTPGSFYKRLFPTNTLHFVHSSFSLHWLSQVPAGLIKEDGEALNKGCVLSESSSPLEVHELYRLQFKRDFISFLRHRSIEVVSGGRMLLTFVCRHDVLSDSTRAMDLVSKALNQMVSEGLLDQAQLDKFNMPYYRATVDDINEAITVEGSFVIHKLEKNIVSYDALSKNMDDSYSDSNLSIKVKYLVNTLRAVTESMFATEFGEGKMDCLYKKLEGIIEYHYMSGKIVNEVCNVAVSLIKKE